MTRTKRHRLATATREEVSREGSLDQFRGQGSSRGAFHRAAQLGIIAVGASERASYNGSIEASQASDVGSIPIARSINPVDAVGFTDFFFSNYPPNFSVLDALGGEEPAPLGFWTRKRSHHREPNALREWGSDPRSRNGRPKQSCSTGWAGSREKIRPSKKCFFLDSFYRTSQALTDLLPLQRSKVALRGRHAMI